MKNANKTVVAVSLLLDRFEITKKYRIDQLLNYICKQKPTKSVFLLQRNNVEKRLLLNIMH